MNERIWELANQAYSDDMPYDSNIPTEFIVRLSELIVGECVRKIEDIAESSNDPQPIYRVAVELLEHFGVKE